MFLDGAINNVRYIAKILKDLPEYEQIEDYKQKRIPSVISDKQHCILIDKIIPEVKLCFNKISNTQQEYFLHGNPLNLIREREKVIDKAINMQPFTSPSEKFDESLEKEELIKKIEDLKIEIQSSVKNLSLDEIKDIINEIEPEKCDEDTKMIVDKYFLRNMKIYTNERVKFFEDLLTNLKKNDL
ncbi:hypothetical protein H312_00748 [Anncaliia algerae PRA339]|uniref:Uncharacterized protein n=1 Tax=Anncaliia algerae PRA339 TaxID=1288291 RepID=A0A059F4B8_9MICR|nr:hypothetical protein H312_00748 [Anncaliia algerae PRA339]